MVDFRIVDFSLFKDLLVRILWERALERKRVQENCPIFKNHAGLTSWKAAWWRIWGSW